MGARRRTARGRSPPGRRRAGRRAPAARPLGRRDRPARAWGVETARSDSAPAPVRRRLLNSVEGGAPDDEPDQRVGRGVGDARLADLQAVAHHHHPVGDAEDLVEAMGHVDHADVAAAQPPHGLEQALDLVGRQARGRLVQHQEIALDHQGTGDGDQRLLGAAEAVDPRVGSMSQPMAISAARRAARHRASRSARGWTGRANP